MRSPLLLLFVCVLSVACTSADNGEPFYTPHGLDPVSITQRLISEYTKPGYIYAELAGSKVVAGYSLLFRARVDYRPLVVDGCLICAETILASGVREWWLMCYYRHPYGPRVGHAEWRLSQQSDVHSDHNLRRLAARPANKEVQDFMTWANWDHKEFVGFKDIQYLSFYSEWKKLTREEAPNLNAALPWPPKD